MRCSASLAFSFLVLLNQSPGVAVAEGVRTPDDETPTEEESEFDLNLWFLWEFPRTLPSGAKRKSFLGLVHRTIGPDGRLVSWSVLNYWSGPDYQVLFPLFYRTGPEGEKHLGIIPLYFQGPDYWATPFALSAGWRDEGDISHNWITPLFHFSLDEGGALHSLHLGPYVQGRYYQVLFPLFYRAGPEGGKHLGIIPLYFQGPDYWTAPLALAGGWRNADTSVTSWLTPIFSRRTFPNGDVKAAMLWPLFNYYRGQCLDTSLSMQLGPFVYQHAGQDYEFNFLWRLFSIQRRGEYSRVAMFPIWWQERPSPQTLSQFTILGGLIARDCNYDDGTYRYRILWFIPVTGSRSFTTEEDNGSESLPPKEN